MVSDVSHGLPLTGSIQDILNQIWVTAWLNQQNYMCSQRRLRFARASDQSLCCPHEKKPRSLATHWAHSEDWLVWAMPRLIWVFAWHTFILLVLSCAGSYNRFAQMLFLTAFYVWYILMTLLMLNKLKCHAHFFRSQLIWLYTVC